MFNQLNQYFNSDIEQYDYRPRPLYELLLLHNSTAHQQLVQWAQPEILTGKALDIIV